MNEDYMAFLLRLRRSPERPQWRASLENAHTGSMHHFASQEELFSFLTDQLAADPSLPNQDTGHDSGPTSG